MIAYFIIVLGIVGALIIIVTPIALNLNTKKYFEGIEKEGMLEIRFFVKKHTIFRFFALLYAVIHYSLNIISVTASFVTVYMIIDDKLGINVQIFFLLTAAITTNLIFGLRIDKISEAYAQAMRILEYAILKYSLEGKMDILYEANDRAEQCIGNKFF